MQRILFPLLAFLAAGSGSTLAQDEGEQRARAEKTVAIRTLAARMRYDVAEFSVPAGARLRLVLENADALPHNWVLCAPAEDRGMEVAQAAWEMGVLGLERDWIPDHPGILAASRMLQPHETQILEIDVPGQTGVYPYVCTFPGHAMLMNGIMRVTGPGQGIADLTYRFYLGAFERVPDFDALRPHREGKLEDGLLGFRLDDYREQFAVEFHGYLDAPQDGQYRFFLASDDGANLFLDGRKIIDNDGIHGSGAIRERRLQLNKGRKELRLGYFEASGEEELFLAWSGPGFEETALSEWVPASRRRGERVRDPVQPGIPLVPEDEPVVYREFIQGASPRGIAVGYPGGLNVVWDAGPMNLALIWRGAFIDAQRHWTDRGAGFQPPLGYDVFSPAPGQPLAILEREDTPWPAAGNPPAGYRFRGYRLDGDRRPVFLFDWEGLRFEDELEPRGMFSSPQAGVARTLRWKEEPPPKLFFRVAWGSAITPGEGGKYLVDERFTVTPDPALKAVLRQAAEGQELLLQLSETTRLAPVTYGWPQ
ncbi:MAG TPA: PA14 domain-containing protein [Verrucomicrobiales bacterium]|nr:PA14 domain-containing protein [Verrucomicrobiales bacterium]